MTEDVPTTKPEDQQRQSRWGRGRRFFAVVAIAVAALFGYTAGKVHSAPWWHWAGHAHFDAEEVSFIVQHRVDRALSQVDATTEQRDKVNAIIKTAVNDVIGLRKEQPDARAKLSELMKAEKIDRSALENLRADKLKMTEAISKRIVQAIADAADILKPEQRQKLVEYWEQHHPHP